MKLFSIRNFFNLGVKGAMLTVSMLTILLLVFLANSLLKIENTEYVFFIFRLTVVAASMVAIRVLIQQRNNGKLSEKHKKSINKIYLYLVVFYITNELLIMCGGD